ncbi:MAG TPA: SURF1 family protein [Rhizomicrobium sp.]|nr:SURF1 family protein [Rhizomicrobium sp.]
MLRFRPYPGATIATVIALVILCGLGSWQLDRLQWKLALIETVNTNRKAPTLTLDQILALPGDAAQYRRVTLTGRFDHGKEAYAFTTSAGGEGVYHVLTPLRLDDGRVFLIDRGAVPERHLDPTSRAAGNPQGLVRITGVWRTPDPPGAFTPPPDRVRHIWYARDVAGIAAANGLKLAAPVVIDADATPNPGGWPRGGQTVVEFRNQHLSYAVTWFGLAACLLGVWLAFHISRGRLVWGKS